MNFILGFLVGSIVISFNPEIEEVVINLVDTIIDSVKNVEIN